MNVKLLSFLGIARKAGKLSLGYDIASESIKNQKSSLVLITSDLSPKTEKNINFLSCTYRVEVIKCSLSMDEIERAIGKRAGIISINDKGFANKVKTIIAD